MIKNMNAQEIIIQWVNKELKPLKNKVGYVTMSISVEDKDHKLLTALHITSNRGTLNKSIKRLKEIYDNRTKLF